MNPISYHYVGANDMLLMHDDIHLHGFPSVKRSKSIPRIIHQFWEGSNGQPHQEMQRCREIHQDWTYICWNASEIARRFPLGRNGDAHHVIVTGSSGKLVNDDMYTQPSTALIMLSDIARYEILMLMGGVYIDADTECLRRVDYLIDEATRVSQAVSFTEKDQSYMHGLIANGVIAMYPYSPLAVTLVSQLRKSDVRKPPWISTGPIFLTSVVRMFSTPAQPYLAVEVMNSEHVYPYHHSTPRLNDVKDVLVAKGAIMDQKWGTTFHSYKNGMQWVATRQPHVGNHSKIFTDYVLQHETGVSTLHNMNPRWVVAALHPHAGMCNRVAHILSCLAFSIATGRALLFDWDEVATEKNVHKENQGQSDFLNLFQQPFVAYSYKEALGNIGLTHEQIMARSGVSITDDNMDFMNSLRASDLDRKYPQSVIHIVRYDWWAPPLFVNDMYAFGMESNQFFSEAFKFLFSPLHHRKDNGECDWLVQVRAIWNRDTAQPESFRQCAVKHGFKPSNTESFLITDKQGVKLDAFTSLPVGCRVGLECDKAAVSTMYAMSHCKNAVLTHTSTFGQCISGLGMIENVYMVSSDGSCSKKAYIDPVDAGVLDSQTPQVSVATKYTTVDTDVHGAFVYMLIKPSEKSVKDFHISLAALHKYFNAERHYPIVLLVDDHSKWDYVQGYAPQGLRINVVQVDQDEWAVPSTAGEYPERFMLPSHPKHVGFNVAYRQMSRFAALHVLSHPALAKYKYVVKIDSDTFAEGQWTKDPFVEMDKKGSSFGFWMSYSDISDVTVNLWETFILFVVKHRLTLKQPGLIMSTSGEYLRTNFYGCFVAAKTAEFRTESYQQLAQHFDAAGGFFRHRWDEQKIWAFYAALYMEPGQVEHMDYVRIGHQTFNTATKAEVHIVPPNVLSRVFAVPTL